MCLLLETIRCENGHLCAPEYHLRRMHGSSVTLFGRPVNTGILADIVVPQEFITGISRCRIIYRSEIEKIEFSSYLPQTIKRLKIVDAGTIDYPHKYADRSPLDKLYQQRGMCDEILIIRKGLITDTSISNVIFFDGNRWFTPAEPLLCGTMRQRLLDQKVIHDKEIPLSDLRLYKKVMLINALRKFDEASAFSIENVY